MQRVPREQRLPFWYDRSNQISKKRRTTMNTNRVSATLTTKDQEGVLAAISGIRQTLPFLIDLTTDERVTMPKLGDKSHAFVKKAVDIATQHPEMVSAVFLDEMRKDAQLFDMLAPIQLAIDLLQKQIDDT